MDIPQNCERRSFSIAETILEIPAPFTAGHVCSAEEASALNQLLAENVRNNKAKRFRQLKTENRFDPVEAQKEINEYVASYEFGTLRSSSNDPIHVEAREIAKGIIKESMRKEGYRLSDITGKKLTELADELIGKNPKILDAAKRRVNDRITLANSML